jgi:hypothetical protein
MRLWEPLGLREPPLILRTMNRGRRLCSVRLLSDGTPDRATKTNNPGKKRSTRSHRVCIGAEAHTIASSPAQRHVAAARRAASCLAGGSAGRLTGSNQGKMQEGRGMIDVVICRIVEELKGCFAFHVSFAHISPTLTADDDKLCLYRMMFFRPNILVTTILGALGAVNYVVHPHRSVHVCNRSSFPIPQSARFDRSCAGTSPLLICKSQH